MKVREWLNSLTKEQLDSYALLGFGFWPSLLMKMVEEDGLRIGCKSRYGFANNMLGAER
jgi:hypothetical protein